MPTTPRVTNLNATSVDILNAIRNSATANYQNYVPVADARVESIREIGAIIMNFPALQNEFLSALVNRIGRVLITNRMYSNPLTVFKKGILEYGETIEEIFVELAKPFQFDVPNAENEVFKREMPDVRAAFHILNYQKFYKTTIQEDQLRQAFLSWSGVTDLISKIVDSMYSGAAYDEYNVTLYLLARHILNGNLYPVSIPAATAQNAKAVAATVKKISNAYEFMSTKYNKAGVHNFTKKADQYLILSADFDATMDVEVLAAAFNMDKAEFSGHRVLVGSFGDIDTARLAEIFDGDSTYVPLTTAELTALDALPGVLVDGDFFMILDNMYKFTEQYNGQGLYWNYWYHVWKTFSVSPFANAAVFVPGTPAITSVTVSPDAVTAGAGQKVNLTATVVTTYFASKAVNWTLSDNAPATVDIYGTVVIDEDATTGTTITVTATSVFDPTKSDTCTITVG